MSETKNADTERVSADQIYPWDDENYVSDNNTSDENTSAINSNAEILITNPSQSNDGTEPPEKVNQSQLMAGDLVAMNSELSQQIFHQSDDNWNGIIAKRQAITVVEEEPRSILTKSGWKSISKPVAEVSAQLTINKNVAAAVEQCIRNSPLEPFDKIVLEACATHQYLGKEYITASAIFKYMGGNGDPNPKMRQLIIDSVDKLRGLDIRIDATEAYKKLERLQCPIGKPKRKPNKQGRIILVDNLLSAKRLEIEVDGHIIDAIKFKDVSPIFLYTQDKGETVMLSQKFLAASKLRATKDFVVLKHYILCRIRSIQRSKKGGGKTLESVLTFDGMYRNCGDPERAKSDRSFKKRIREAAIKYLTSLIDGHEIQSFSYLDRNNQPQTEVSKAVKVVVKI